jgi:tetratricopeptide (TPR) repeat protein
VKRSFLICSLGFIALTLLASTVWTRGLWALSSWAAVSPFIGFVCAILIAPQLFLKPPPAPFRLIPAIRPDALRLLIVAAVSMTILWLLRSRNDLWGERATLGAAITGDAYRPSAPLSTLAQWALYRFMNGVFLWSAGSIMTFFSMLAGFLYTLFAIRAAELLSTEGHERGEKRLTAAVLLSNGFVALFFGCGVNVSIAMSLTLAFIVTELQFLQGARSLVLPAALIAAAILSHLAAVFLMPAFIFTLVVALKSRAGGRKALIAVVGALLLGWVILEIGFSHATGKPGSARYLYGAMVRSVAALDSGGWTGFAHSLWVAVNSLLIIGPASVVALLLLVTGRRRADAALQSLPRNEERFLSLCAVSALIMFIAGSRLLDEGLTWHVFAATGPAFSMYALWALKKRFSGPERFAQTAWALVLLGMFQVIPLVVVDSVPRFAEKRILELPLAPGRGEMIIADAALENGKLDAAHTWYLASVDKNPSNVISHARIGRIEMKQEDYSAAISHFLKAHELKPADPHYRFELAEALIANRWFPEAIAHLETLTVAYPDSVAFWRKLGFARNNGNRYEPAIAAYEKALVLEPNNEENVRNLVSALLNRAAELQGEKEYDDARILYNRAIALFPRDWRAYNNLATIEMDVGRTDAAFEILAEALKLHPYESSLHFNMGIVLEKRGRLKEALDHMRTAQELEPVYSNAPMHIERLEKRLGVWKPAQGDSQRSPLKIP